MNVEFRDTSVTYFDVNVIIFRFVNDAVRGVACRTHVRRCFHIDLTILIKKKFNKKNQIFF